MPIPDKRDRITPGLIELIVEIRMGSASPEAHGRNVGTMDMPEKSGVL